VPLSTINDNDTHIQITILGMFDNDNTINSTMDLQTVRCILSEKIIGLYYYIISIAT